MPNDRLRSLAERSLSAGELPADGPVTTLGGSSSGVACQLCRHTVPAGEPEIELVWAVGDSRRKAVLHPACHAAWLVVRSRRSTDAALADAGGGRL